jgi:hypothetical protein
MWKGDREEEDKRKEIHRRSFYIEKRKNNA